MSLAANMDTLDIARLQASLTTTRFTHLEHFATIGSTSTALLAAAAEGAPEGTVYLADEQTAGRGRGAHAWHSIPGDGLYLSALVRPSLRLRDALLLSLASGLAVWQAVYQTTGFSLDLRWPNDLMAGHRKCGGILVETAVEPGADSLLRSAVIGLGLNVHHRAFPDELSSLATSLAIENSKAITRTTLALAVLRALDLELTSLESQATESLASRFAAHSTWISGKRVHVPEQGGYTGLTAGLDEHGFLLIDTDEGIRRTVLSGGVRAA